MVPRPQTAGSELTLSRCSNSSSYYTNEDPGVFPGTSQNIQTNQTYSEIRNLCTQNQARNKRPFSFLKRFLRSPGLTPDVSPTMSTKGSRTEDAWKLCGHHFSPQQSLLSPSCRWGSARLSVVQLGLKPRSQVPHTSPVTC